MGLLIFVLAIFIVLVMEHFRSLKEKSNEDIPHDVILNNKSGNENVFIGFSNEILTDKDQIKRMIRANDPFTYLSDIRTEYPQEALVHSGSGHTYHTSLEKCDCEDFISRGRPCKHMHRLAIYCKRYVPEEYCPNYKTFTYARTNLTPDRYPKVYGNNMTDGDVTEYDEPTERQMRWALTKGIKIPARCSWKDMSALLNNCEEQYSDKSLQDFAIAKGLVFSRYTDTPNLVCMLLEHYTEQKDCYVAILVLYDVYRTWRKWYFDDFESIRQQAEIWLANKTFANSLKRAGEPDAHRLSEDCYLSEYSTVRKTIRRYVDDYYF